MLYGVKTNKSEIILAGNESIEMLRQNIINTGYLDNEFEILTEQQYEERKALEPQPEQSLSEVEQLRLEMARSNAEMFETMLSLMGGM